MMTGHFQFSCSVCLTLCNPMDAARQASLNFIIFQSFMTIESVIQPSHPLLSPSPPAFSLALHQGLFQSVSSLYLVAKVLERQHQSFQ